MISVTILGASGRMGGALIRAIRSFSKDITLAAAVDRAGLPCIGMDSGTVAGIQPNGIAVTDDLDAAVKACDVVIDFTFHTAVQATAPVVAKYKKGYVLGTTGLTEEEAKRIVQEEDLDSEYYDALFTAYSQGTDDGYLNGATAEAHNDALKALYNCFKDGWEVKWTGEELQCKVTKEAIVRDYISDDLNSSTEYSSDPAEDLIYCIITSRYELSEPYEGWDDFDEDSFNTIFQERLEEELGE